MEYQISRTVVLLTLLSVFLSVSVIASHHRRMPSLNSDRNDVVDSPLRRVTSQNSDRDVIDTLPRRLPPHNSTTSQRRTPALHPEQRADGCVYENRTYTPGERVRPDPCTLCHCPRHGVGRMLCTVHDCQKLDNCLRLSRRDDECCGTCLEQGCRHSDGKVYRLGTIVVDSPCERCECPVSGGPTVCTPKTECPSTGTDCVDAVLPPNECCPVCPNGLNCWLGRRIISHGEVVDVGHCRKCSCPDHVVPHWRKHTGSQAVCNTANNC